MFGFERFYLHIFPVAFAVAFFLVKFINIFFSFDCLIQFKNFDNLNDDYVTTIFLNKDNFPY